MQKHTRLRGIASVGVAAALTLVGVIGQIPSAHAATVTPGTGANAPKIKVVASPTQFDDNTGNPIYQVLDQGPQVGTVLLVDLGKWSDGSTDASPASGTRFAYAWYQTSDPTTQSTTDGASSRRTAKSYAPIVADIGSYIQVAITACSGGTGDVTTCTGGQLSGPFYVTTSAKVVGVNPNMVTAPDTSTSNTYVSQFGDPSNPKSANYLAPGTNYAWMTFYGYPDNTPPSADVASPNFDGPDLTFPNHFANMGIHANQQAGGDGSYENPLTMATGANFELPYGQEIYIPRFQKYFIAEDQCTECRADMQGSSDTNPDGTLTGGDDGGPGLLHFDLWIGGPAGDWPDTILCEDALTLSNDDGTPYMDKVILNPGPDEFVARDAQGNVIPIFDPTTGLCNAQYDASGNLVDSTSLDGGSDVGLYQSTSSDPGLCITDPDNGTAIGTQLTLEPCDPTRADQNLTFTGMSMMFNNLCFDMSDPSSVVGLDEDGNPYGMSDPDPSLAHGDAYPVTLRRCDLNPYQQWELGYDGTISDIQNSQFYFADLGPSADGVTYLWATDTDTMPDGIEDFNYWDYPFMDLDLIGMATVDASITGSTVAPGGTVTLDVSGLTTPTFDVYLVNSDDETDAVRIANPADSDGVFTADAKGEFHGTVTLPKSTAAGDYMIKVQGLTGYDTGARIPKVTADPLSDVLSSTAITRNDQIFVNSGGYQPTTANFKQINRTTAVFRLSNTITVAASSGPKSETGGQVSSSPAPWLGVISLIGFGLAAVVVRRRGLLNA